MKTDPAPASRLAILICGPSVERPELFVTPLVHALAARALDCEVELHFAGPAVRILVEGIPNERYAVPGSGKSLLDFLRETVASGVRLLACSMARSNWIDETEPLIPECEGIVGATTFVARVLDPDWKTMIF